jgi:hypothetical protein
MSAHARMGMGAEDYCTCGLPMEHPIHMVKRHELVQWLLQPDAPADAPEPGHGASQDAPDE